MVDIKDAEAILTVLNDSSQKIILSLNAAGRTVEFRLLRTFSFRVNATGAAAPAVPPIEYIPPTTISVRRDITFSDDLVLSKESEEALLQRDMQSDLVQQLMRRLATAKAQPVKVDAE